MRRVGTTHYLKYKKCIVILNFFRDLKNSLHKIKMEMEKKKKKKSFIIIRIEFQNGGNIICEHYMRGCSLNVICVYWKTVLHVLQDCTVLV